MPPEMITAIIAAGGAFLGSVFQPAISGWISKKQANNTQSAIDQRKLGQLYAERRVQALADLAEAMTIVKFTADRFYITSQQAPEDNDTKILKKELKPAIEQYYAAKGRYSAFEENSAFDKAIDDFSEDIKMSNNFLHQSFTQGVKEPTNAPKFDQEEFTDNYKTAMEQIRSKLTEPIKEWSVKKDSQ